MGKRLDQLDLGDSGPSSVDELARGRRQAQRLYDEVIAMLESGEYDFAWGYLKDLSLTLETADRVTDRQVQAVENIREGQAKHEAALEQWERHESRTGRRYEGFDRTRHR